MHKAACSGANLLSGFGPELDVLWHVPVAWQWNVQNYVNNDQQLQNLLSDSVCKYASSVELRTIQCCCTAVQLLVPWLYTLIRATTGKIITTVQTQAIGVLSLYSSLGLEVDQTSFNFLWSLNRRKRVTGYLQCLVRFLSFFVNHVR